MPADDPRPTPDRGFYVAGGTLGIDALCYVERRADHELIEALDRGDFCYLLTARQMGKSSLMVRTAARLRERGTKVVVLDLTAMGENLTAEQWYEGLLEAVGLALGLEDALEAFWLTHEGLGPVRRFMRALQEVVLGQGLGVGSWELGADDDKGRPTAAGPSSQAAAPNSRLVIFIDEIDAVRSLPFSTDEFFAAIRECYNRRAEDREFERLTFCLLGVASPSDLIRDTRVTPFNIGRRIELTDFTAAEAQPLAIGLVRAGPALAQAPSEHEHDPDPSAQRLLQRILYWTGGHPYLTQRLCQTVAEANPKSEFENPKSVVDRLCEELFLSRRARGQDDNLLFVRERLLRSEMDVAALLELYRQVRLGKRVRDDQANPVAEVLRLSGVVRREAGCLRVRNRIYFQVFDQEWVWGNMPDAELRRQRAAFRRGLWRAAAVSGVVLAAMGSLAVTAIRQSRLALERGRALRRTLYSAQTNLAQQAAEAADMERAEELLLLQKPGPGEEDLRGWEWRYLWRLSHQDDSMATLEPNLWFITDLAFSPDGRTLAATGQAGALTLWDVSSRRMMAPVLGLGGPVRSLCFSPDGRSIASAHRDGTVRWWRIDDQQTLAVLNAHPGGANAVRISPDGRWMATFGQDSRVKLWRVDGGRALRLVHSIPGGEPLAFSPDGRTLIYHHGLVWDLAAARSTGRLAGPGDVANSMAFSPDGKLLAAGGTQLGAVWLWNMATRQVVAAFPGRTGGGSWYGAQVAFCPDGKLMAAGGADGVVHLWRIADREEIATLRGHRGPITCLAFSPDGQTLATGSTDETVKLWRTTPKPADVLRRGSSPAVALAITPDGRWLASAGGDRAATVWDLRARRPVAVLRGHQRRVTNVAIAPDGQRVATGSADDTIRLWDTATGRQLASFAGFANANFRAVAFSPDGRLLARQGADGAIKLWDVTARRDVASLAGHTGFVGNLRFTPDGRRLVSAAGPPDAHVRVWDVISHRQVLLLSGFLSWAGPCAISPDGRLLAVGSRDYNVRVFDLATGSLLTILQGNKDQLGTIAFSPVGRTLMTACADGTLKFWSTASWAEAAAFIDPNLFGAAVFSPDGRSLFTAEEGGSIRIWRAETPAEAEPQVQWAQHLQAAGEAGKPGRAGDPVAALPHLDWLLRAQPDEAFLLDRRADVHVQLRQWDQAAADCRRLLRLKPGDQYTWKQLAHVELAGGDLRGYRRACRAFLDHLGQSADQGVENMIGWTCALAPNAVPNPMLPVKLAERALSGSPGDGNLMNTLGADLYRAGRFEAAVHMMQEAMQHKGHGGNEWDWPFLAMAHARLGHTAEARLWLAKTEKAIRPLLAQSTDPSLPADWDHRLELDQMLREAEQTVSKA